ncbi:hypothetical protein AB0L57_16210 [Nocardia sp. NPDC052254]|uniref:alpha/beta hydrolase family protein n=1 Tax=Nocardia sp. NPDC052254 TaxID=3155681 RepID=UPI00343ECE34
MITRRLIAVGLATVALLCMGAGGAGGCPCAPLPAPVVAPAGAHPVGRAEAELDDGDRDVMVSAWYPTTVVGTAAYIPATGPIAAVEIAGLAAQWMHTPSAAVTMVAATVAATEGAPIDVSLGHLAVVVMSPGLGTPRWILSGLAAEIASRGHIVIVIDHTGESPAVEFPDGRIVVGKGTRPDEAGYMRARLEDRLADTRLVLDRLPMLPVVGPMVDLQRVAMLGHSYGGLTAAHAMSADSRIRDAVMVDSSAGWPGVTGPAVTDRPVLALQLTDPWPADARRQPAADAVTLAGAAHYSATDLCGLGGAPELCGTIEPDRATAICRAVIDGWLDRQLHGDTGPRFEVPELKWQLP